MARMSITPDLVKRASDRFSTDEEAAAYLGIDISRYRRYCVGFGIRTPSQRQRAMTKEVPILDEEEEAGGEVE
jgi:hypothetical protein